MSLVKRAGVVLLLILSFGFVVSCDESSSNGYSKVSSSQLADIQGDDAVANMMTADKFDAIVTAEEEGIFFGPLQLYCTGIFNALQAEYFQKKGISINAELSVNVSDVAIPFPLGESVSGLEVNRLNLFLSAGISNVFNLENTAAENFKKGMAAFGIIYDYGDYEDFYYEKNRDDNDYTEEQAEIDWKAALTDLDAFMHLADKTKGNVALNIDADLEGGKVTGPEGINFENGILRFDADLKASFDNFAIGLMKDESGLVFNEDLDILISAQGNLDFAASIKFSFGVTVSSRNENFQSGKYIYTLKFDNVNSALKGDVLQTAIEKFITDMGVAESQEDMNAAINDLMEAIYKKDFPAGYSPVSLKVEILDNAGSLMGEKDFSIIDIIALFGKK